MQPEPLTPEAPDPGPARPSALRRLLHTGPIRRFLSTHDLHILPAAVSHRRRVRQVLPVVGVAIIIFAAWWWVIPRTDVVVKAQYHEGLFNTIAVDMKIINSGTTELEPLHIEVVVTETGNNTAMGFFNTTTSLGAHRTYNAAAIQFKGDQITTSYAISIKLTYTAGSDHVVKGLDFRTEEPYMNLYFEGRVA